MPAALCSLCGTARASILRPKDGSKLCKTCFLWTFEEEVHETITRYRLFRRPRRRRGEGEGQNRAQHKDGNGGDAATTGGEEEVRGERVAIGASGGKDSTVLASVLTTLNARHNYGLDLCLLSIDEGIRGYRDDSLAAVARFSASSGLPLRVLGYRELYGWTMDEVVGQIGKKGNCTYCGVFRRQALDRGARLMGVRHVVTGHNADDLAETVVMNLLRGDLARVGRASEIVTGDDGLTRERRKKHGRRKREGSLEERENSGQEKDVAGGEDDDDDEDDEDGEDDDDDNCECEEHPSKPADMDANSDIDWQIKRSKPLKYAYEKEIVLYALHKGLDYFSTECIYSPEAFRGSARTLIKQLERIRPSSILETVHSGEQMARLVPGQQSRQGRMDDEEEDGVSAAGGCGKSSGRNGGGEMAAMEEALRRGDAQINGRPERQSNDVDTEVDFTTATAAATRSPRNHTKFKPKGQVPSSSSIPTSSSNPHHRHGTGPVEKASNTTTILVKSTPRQNDSMTSSLSSRQQQKPQKQEQSGPKGVGKCTRCGYMSSQGVCKACMLLEGLNRNRPKMGIHFDDDSGGGGGGGKESLEGKMRKLDVL